MAQPIILASKVSYRGKTFSVSEENVRMPNGGTFWHEVVQKKDTVAVIVLDEKKRIYFIKEFRTGLRAKAIKLPGGAVEHGESPVQAARRELAEEIGVRPTGLRLLFRASGSATLRWNRYYYYAAGVTPDRRQPDTDEEIEIIRLPLRRAVTMAWRGDFYQGDIAYAILRFARLKGKL